jgi:hypothetical protein
MKKAHVLVVTSSLMVLVVAGCAGEAGGNGNGEEAAVAMQAGQELPPGHPPMPQQDTSGIVPPPPDSGQGAAGLSWTPPADWQVETPSSSMRRAQYRVAGAAGDAECVVFYFGPGQGGDPQANVLRWADQFGQPDGRSSREVLISEELVVGETPILTAEVKGIYSGGMTGSGAQTPRADSMLLGAVAMGPDANWFFKFTGPESTVEGNREQFMSLLQSISVGE